MHEDGSIEKIQYYESGSNQYGFSYGQWTVRWWRWFLSTPAHYESGNFAFGNQPLADVWFLAGKVGDDSRSLPTRSCKVPSSSSVLFPVINCEINSLEFPELTKEDELIRYVSAEENTIIVKECFVDGISIPAQRVGSSPKIFEVELNEDNPYDVKGGGKTKAAADGYWVFLKPLPKGEHRIVFRGSCENGRLNSGADYHVIIE